MIQLANCYVHLKYRRLEPSEFDRLSQRLRREAVELAAAYIKRGQRLDYTLEEGTLFQRIIVIGTLVLGAVHEYHALRESVIDIVHDAETFGGFAIEKFHQITNTTPADDIYTRKSSRDLNRIERVVDSFDRVAAGEVARSELPQIRTQVIRDLAGLARANPDDPEIAKFMHLLPKKRIPNLPSTPMEAIKINQAEDRKRPVKERSETEQSVAPRRRRRYHASVPIDQVKVPMAR